MRIIWNLTLILLDLIQILQKLHLLYPTKGNINLDNYYSVLRIWLICLKFQEDASFTEQNHHLVDVCGISCFPRHTGINKYPLSKQPHPVASSVHLPESLCKVVSAWMYMWMRKYMGIYSLLINKNFIRLHLVSLFVCLAMSYLKSSYIDDSWTTMTTIFLFITNHIWALHHGLKFMWILSNMVDMSIPKENECAALTCRWINYHVILRKYNLSQM